MYNYRNIIGLCRRTVPEKCLWHIILRSTYEKIYFCFYHAVACQSPTMPLFAQSKNLG